MRRNVDHDIVELRGSSISYLTGKMENYFRLKGIPHRLERMVFPSEVERNKKVLGISQMPTVHLPDGRWMTDTTAMIEWFEREYPDNSVVPNDPVQAFVCFLLEGWADEWWWRPAMHYRWFYEEGARFASGHLAREVMGGLHLPLFVKRAMPRRRQRNGYGCGDGIGAEAVSSVEADVAALFSQLEVIFSKRHFLLGDRPTLADIGFSGPSFRHFALDPIPLQLLRHTAPNTLEWVMRLWISRPKSLQGALIKGVPDDIRALLQHMARGYLPYLNANVEAVRQAKSTFAAEVDGVNYTWARTSHYRVWCLPELRLRFNSVPQDVQPRLQALLTEVGILELLWAQYDLPLSEDQDSRLPFWADYKMLQVNTQHYGVILPWRVAFSTWPIQLR